MTYALEYQESPLSSSLPVVAPMPHGTVIPQHIPPQNFLLLDAKNDKTLSVRRSDETNGERPLVETFIADVYFAVHKAKLNAFMPELFAIRNDDNQPVAAIGLRRIDTGPIFLEQYLDTSVEDCVSDVAGRSIARNSIAEVGNLASMSLGGGRQLIAFMVHHLAASGISYGVCTGTSAVRAALKRMGIEFSLVREAEAACLGDDQVHWGNYYQHNPFVLVVDVLRATRHLYAQYGYAQDLK